MRLISGHMIVIRHQSSPKSSLELYHKQCAIFTNSIKRAPSIKWTPEGPESVRLIEVSLCVNRSD